MAEHGLAWSLPRVVGVSKALDLLFSARVVQGEEALSLGLVDRIFERDVLMDGDAGVRAEPGPAQLPASRWA